MVKVYGLLVAHTGTTCLACQSRLASKPATVRSGALGLSRTYVRLCRMMLGLRLCFGLVSPFFGAKGGLTIPQVTYLRESLADLYKSLEQRVAEAVQEQLQQYKQYTSSTSSSTTGSTTSRTASSTGPQGPSPGNAGKGAGAGGSFPGGSAWGAKGPKGANAGAGPRGESPNFAKGFPGFGKGFPGFGKGFGRAFAKDFAKKARKHGQAFEVRRAGVPARRSPRPLARLAACLRACLAACLFAGPPARQPAAWVFPSMPAAPHKK